ncbi:MAG: hypothetical protein ACTSQJ_05795 [Promethearchaeota archaeon]
MIGSIVLKPYIALEPNDRDFIVILCIINLFFSAYYIYEAFHLEKVFKLEYKHIKKFGKRIGIVTTIYSPHLIFVLSLLLRNLHELQNMMIYIIIPMEACLIGVVFKEVYDLIFMEEGQRMFELEMNRKRYIEKKEKTIDDRFM